MGKGYQYKVLCTKCHKVMTIYEVFFTKGVEISFFVLCIPCGIDEERVIDFLDIQAGIRKGEGVTVLKGTGTVQ
jgi:hypothetical protein